MTKICHDSVTKISRQNLLLLLCSGFFVVSTLWHHFQQELPSPPPITQPKIQRVDEAKIPFVSHDLDMFIPLKNASTTFTVDNVKFVMLNDRVATNDTTNSNPSAFQWKVPNIADDSNHLPNSMLQSAINQTSHIHLPHICQVVCRFDKASSAILHFPHFLQQALPCYSVFHYVAKMINSEQSLRNYMVLPAIRNKFPPYIQNIVRVMEGSPYYVHMIYGFDESIPVHEDCHRIPVKEQHLGHGPSSTTTTPNALLAIKAFSDPGWDKPTRYFLSSDATVKCTDDATKPKQQTNEYYDGYELIQQIQKSVLGVDHYHPGPSLLENDDHHQNITAKKNRWLFHAPPMEPLQYRVLQILILDRKSSSRAFENVNNTIHALHNYRFNHSSVITKSRNVFRTTNGTTTTQFRLNVTYISSFNGYTLYEQAYIVHHADIIYSPHGAQLSNLLYVRPCTVVVEFFPMAYYLQFFQSLVLSAKGISYEGYPSVTTNSTDKVTDTRLTSQHYHLRAAARSVTVNVTSDFFIKTLPQLIDATIQCRSNYKTKVE